MDGFVYMGVISRIEHYEQIARKMARERRNVGNSKQEAVRLAMADRPGEAVLQSDKKSA